MAEHSLQELKEEFYHALENNPEEYPEDASTQIEQSTTAIDNKSETVNEFKPSSNNHDHCNCLDLEHKYLAPDVISTNISDVKLNNTNDNVGVKPSCEVEIQTEFSIEEKLISDSELTDCTCIEADQMLSNIREELRKLDEISLQDTIQIPHDVYANNLETEDERSYLKTISERTEAPSTPLIFDEECTCNTNEVGKLTIHNMPQIDIRPAFVVQKVFQINIKPTGSVNLTVPGVRNVLYEEISHKDIGALEIDDELTDNHVTDAEQSEVKHEEKSFLEQEKPTFYGKSLLDLHFSTKKQTMVDNIIDINEKEEMLNISDDLDLSFNKNGDDCPEITAGILKENKNIVSSPNENHETKCSNEKRDKIEHGVPQDIETISEVGVNKYVESLKESVPISYDNLPFLDITKNDSSQSLVQSVLGEFHFGIKSLDDSQGKDEIRLREIGSVSHKNLAFCEPTVERGDSAESVYVITYDISTQVSLDSDEDVDPEHEIKTRKSKSNRVRIFELGEENLLSNKCNSETCLIPCEKLKSFQTHDENKASGELLPERETAEAFLCGNLKNLVVEPISTTPAKDFKSVDTQTCILQRDDKSIQNVLPELSLENVRLHELQNHEGGDTTHYHINNLEMYSISGASLHVNTSKCKSCGHDKHRHKIKAKPPREILKNTQNVTKKKLVRGGPKVEAREMLHHAINMSSSDSNTYHLDSTLSEGEVRCKCSVSSGEVHACPRAYNVRDCTNYFKRHPELLLRYELGEDVRVCAKKTYNDNWVAYFTSGNIRQSK